MQNYTTKTRSLAKVERSTVYKLARAITTETYAGRTYSALGTYDVLDVALHTVNADISGMIGLTWSNALV